MNDHDLTQHSPALLARMGDYKGALKLYLNRLRLERNPSDFASLAGCLYKLGRLDCARKYALHALSISNGSCSAASLVLANICTETGDDVEAVRIYLGLVKTDMSIYAYQGLATICRMRGRLRRAVKILRLISKASPNEVSLHCSLGALYMETSDHRHAWESFSQCLLLDSNYIDAWHGLFQCALALNDMQIALLITEKLLELDHESPKVYEYRGRVLFEIDCAKESAEAFKKAFDLQPSNIIYYLNAANPCARIPRLGIDVHALACSVKASSLSVDTFLTKHQISFASRSRQLIPFAYYCAYSPYNLKRVLAPYCSMLERIYQDELDAVITNRQNYCQSSSPHDSSFSGKNLSSNKSTHKKKVRIGLLSRYFSAHSHTQAFDGLIHYLDRDRFELILIHRHATTVDAIQLELNSLADEVVYLWESLEYTFAILSSLCLDILFFTDLGMDPYDFLIPALRACPVQVTGWGLPHTSGLTSIDYYLSSNLLESPEHQEEYTEKLVLLDGLPCCYMHKNLSYRKTSRDYFMLPSNRVLVGCIQNFWKIHPDFDLILEKIAKRLNDVTFVFIETSLQGSNQSFLKRFATRAPQAYSQTIFLARASTADFLPLCDCIDIILDTPYYGAGVTAYMSMYVGSPIVCFSGARLRDSTTAALYRYLAIDNAPIVNSVHDYIDKVISLALDSDLRLQIKQDTVSAAYRLYDNQQYVRSFECFCLNLMAAASLGRE